MKIGIITREIQTTDVAVNGIPITYLNVIKQYGTAIFIDNSIDLKANHDYIKSQINEVDSFIIPGGDTINNVDLYIIDHCYKNDIPLLGICLGMQEIAYYFDQKGLTPIGDLSHFDMKAKYLHEIKLVENGYLYKLLNTKSIYVNSRHKFKIKENRNYTVEAISDTVIEAIKVKNKKYILGLQFHPEIMYPYDNNAKIIFDDFMNVKKTSS